MHTQTVLGLVKLHIDTTKSHVNIAKWPVNINKFIFNIFILHVKLKKSCIKHVGRQVLVLFDAILDFLYICNSYLFAMSLQTNIIMFYVDISINHVNHCSSISIHFIEKYFPSTGSRPRLFCIWFLKLILLKYFLLDKVIISMGLLFW